MIDGLGASQLATRQVKPSVSSTQPPGRARCHAHGGRPLWARGIANAACPRLRTGVGMAPGRAWRMPSPNGTPQSQPRAGRGEQREPSRRPGYWRAIIHWKPQRGGPRLLTGDTPLAPNPPGLAPFVSRTRRSSFSWCQGALALQSVAMSINTSERCDRITELVRNEFPDCEVVFLQNDADELAFRIRSSQGNYRTGTIRLLSHHSHVVINKAWLQKQVAEHGGPHSP